MNGMANRYVVLDGLRGVAAAAVVLYHFGSENASGIAAHGYLAVDFFFVLSGFVIASAYEKRLASTLSVPDFVVQRVIRLYPMIVIGLMVWLAIWLAGLDRTLTSPVANVAMLLLMALLLIPYEGDQSTLLFPVNPPLWSLSSEMLINVIYGLISPSLKTKVLLPAVLIMVGLYVLIGVQRHDLHLGFANGTWLLGVLRTAALFGAGVLTWRFHRVAKLPLLTSNGLAVGLAIALFGFFMLPSLPGLNGMLHLAAAFVAFPALVLAGSQIATGPKLSLACDLSGRLSYPVYVLHLPIVAAAAHQWRASEPVLAALIALVVLTAVSALAWLALMIDEPVRDYLSKLIRKRRTSAIGASANIT
jgi:peptidoglycan/LPS O-acetylase OafA/YrhL